MIRFDPIKNRIYNDERSIKIGYRETRVLELLLKNSPEIVSKQDIINFAWGSEFIGDTSLAKSISLVRQGFVRLGIKETPIVTVPKIGYRLIDECVFIDSQVTSVTYIPLVTVSDHVPIDTHEIDALSVEQTLSDHQQSVSNRNRLCYFTTGCLLLASALMAFAKINDRSLGDTYPVNRLNEQWIGQMQVFQEQDMVLSPELEAILYKYQCDCVAYISEEPGHSELSLLDKATRQSVNIFYTPAQSDRVSAEIALFLKRGQL
ncbi:transcriptional regulator [Vibrio splendidus]|uniref:Transcriptional regulator n=1 Tax=Vibrio splendidus TaxID=29497 RepID=A0A2N7F781_VIBSP|nr:winged helix-turn-helix domain-containing protein [Vibrio splendidus]PMJ61797.1 transcriptional regulator [Vibrio splendidus]